MKTFETWRKSMGETDDNLSAWEAWHARDEDFAALQRQLEPSPCGHRNADFKKHLPHESWPDHCEACVRDRRREQEIRREERERISSLVYHAFNEYLMESRKPSVSELIERIRYRIRALPEREGGKDALPPTGKESHI